MIMGFGMGGMEHKIEECAQKVADRFGSVTYIEIGVGFGQTLTAIAETLKASGRHWRAVGIELVNGYSFNREQTEMIAKSRDVPINFITPNAAVVRPAWNNVTVYFRDSQSFLTESWQEPIQFALIDGCHGKPCVILDFLALEAFMVQGGIVMFHDFSAEQFGYKQPHCPGGCDVLGACYELGLLNGKRVGWRQLETMRADRTQDGWDMGVFERIKI
jgi:hypothetical protein